LLLVLLAVAGSVALAVTLLVIGRGSDEAAAPTPRGNAAVLKADGASMTAAWASRPRTLAEMALRAKSVALVTVTAIAQGAPIRGDEPDDTVPTQRIRFEVKDRWRGSSPATFVLFKTGTARWWIENDPPYEVGEQYVLFASPRPDDPTTYLPEGPDGRIKVVDGRLRPLIEGPAAAALGGRGVAQAKQSTAAATGGSK
jgi:hypothetical protein